MIYDVVLYPDAPLQDIAAPVTEFTDDLITLAQDMLETMNAYDGVGLAAPQIGLSKRVIVLCEPQVQGQPQAQPMCIVNPEILESDGSATGDEGCLSMPRIYGQVPRATRLHVIGTNEQGEPLDFEARDFLARIIQHEVDHLNGVMFPDRLDIFTREDLYQQWQMLRAEIEAEAKHLKL